MNEESRRPNPPWGPGKGSFMKVSLNYLSFTPRSGPRRSRGTGRSVPTEEASRGQPKDRGAGTSVASRGSHVSDEGREANQTRGVTSETASVATKGAK